MLTSLENINYIDYIDYIDYNYYIINNYNFFYLIINLTFIKYGIM